MSCAGVAWILKDNSRLTRMLKINCHPMMLGESLEARQAISRQFKDGYRTLDISGNGLLCGLRAVCLAARVRGIGNYPTVPELQKIYETDKEIAEFLDDTKERIKNNFNVDAVGTVLKIWGEALPRRLELRLGYMLADGRVFLVIQKETKDIIWICSSSDSGAVTSSHYEAMAPKLVPSDPYNLDTYLDLKRSTEGIWKPNRNTAGRAMSALTEEKFQNLGEGVEVQEQEYDKIITRQELLDIARKRNEEKDREMDLTPFEKDARSKKKTEELTNKLRRLIYEDMADQTSSKESPRTRNSSEKTDSSSSAKGKKRKRLISRLKSQIRRGNSAGYFR